MCGYEKHVEACHIKPVKEFGMDALLSEVNSAENIAPLCPNCHWELDSGLLLRDAVMSANKKSLERI